MCVNDSVMFIYEGKRYEVAMSLYKKKLLCCVLPMLRSVVPLSLISAFFVHVLHARLMLNVNKT